MPVCLMQYGEEFLLLLIKRSTLRSRINSCGNDWDHCNGYLMMSTVVLVGFCRFQIALTMLVLGKLV